jgi:hypothetical protein
VSTVVQLEAQRRRGRTRSIPTVFDFWQGKSEEPSIGAWNPRGDGEE